MTTLMIHLMITLTVSKDVSIQYKTMVECEAASVAITKTLDKLNENETLGYSWKCVPASKI